MARVAATVVALIIGCSAGASAQSVGDQFRALNESAVKMAAEAVKKVDETREAEARAATLQHQADAVAEKALAQTSQQAKAIVESAQKKADEAKAVAAKVALVPEPQRQALLAKLTEFTTASKASARKYATAALAIVIAGMALSVVTALAGFAGWNRAAGVLSIVVAGVIAIPKAIPVNERASYYRILGASSGSVLLDTELKLNMSVDEYAEAVRQLKVLLEYEGTKYPAGGDIGEITRGLLNDLKSSAPVAKTAMRTSES